MSARSQAGRSSPSTCHPMEGPGTDPTPRGRCTHALRDHCSCNRCARTRASLSCARLPAGMRVCCRVRGAGCCVTRFGNCCPSRVCVAQHRAAGAVPAGSCPGSCHLRPAARARTLRAPPCEGTPRAACLRTHVSPGRRRALCTCEVRIDRPECGGAGCSGDRAATRRHQVCVRRSFARRVRLLRSRDVLLRGGRTPAHPHHAYPVA